MAKEDPQPASSPYERRILDTKGLARRIDLNYIRRRHWLRASRWKLVGIAVALAAAAVIPMLSSFRGTQRAFSAGPVTHQHLLFEQNCKTCHTKPLEPVRDEDCKSCHTGGLLHASSRHGDAAPRCAACHQEHHGATALIEMPDANCIGCHADLSEHGDTVNLLGASRRISQFVPGKHPRFSAEQRIDERPLKLNHSAHLALKASAVPGMKLLMSCQDCHQPAPPGTGFEMVPVTFDMHCAGCHAKELAFDIYQVLEPTTPPAPHLKDPQAIREYVYNAYRDALQRDPTLLRKGPASTPATWLDAVTERSAAYLFERKCVYCHEIEARRGIYPVIRKVHQISGQYSAKREEGIAWLARADFSHAAHRTEKCEDCHVDARKSTQTSDVLIPKMDSCLPCHGASGTYRDRCSVCHVYHDRSQEIARDRRLTQELMRKFTPPATSR